MFSFFLRVCMVRFQLAQWFSNGAPQEVARYAANIMKAYFKNEKKPICTEIFIRNLKYINIFLILYTTCARTFLYVITVGREPKTFYAPSRH
jgi:hypothetical protein